MMHPYKEMSAQKFWSRSVSAGFDAGALFHSAVPLVRKGEKVMSAGSCFAAELVPYLEQNGLTYLRTEYTHPFYKDIPPESLSYGRFTAAYGNIYTARQLLQLFLRAHGRFHPLEDRWREPGAVVDPFRPGLKYPARSDEEFDALTAQHLAAVASAFARCDVLIFTLGLTEAWVSRKDGAVFPACPGTLAGAFDPSLHEFHNFSAQEIVADLNAFIMQLRRVNSRVRLILTVSPVPLVATASDNHVLVATTYSKSVLRVAAEEVSRANADVFYFPSYEIITGPQASNLFFEPDRRNVSREGVGTVMKAFIASCELGSNASASDLASPMVSDPVAASPASEPRPSAGRIASMLSARITAIECEEAAVEI